VTAADKHCKPALAADAAVRAVTVALAAADLPGTEATATHHNGRLVITVTAADPGRLQGALAGLPLTTCSLPDEPGNHCEPPR
jgi:hypothetical protein